MFLGKVPKGRKLLRCKQHQVIALLFLFGMVSYGEYYRWNCPKEVVLDDNSKKKENIQDGSGALSGNSAVEWLGKWKGALLQGLGTWGGQRQRHRIVKGFDTTMLKKICEWDFPEEKILPNICDDESNRFGNASSCAPLADVQQALWMLGERHTGTNALADLMYDNFELNTPNITLEFDVVKRKPKVRLNLGEQGINEHKHDTQKEQYRSGLALVAVRNPYDWVKSMRMQCYGCSKENMKQRVVLNDFLRGTWTSGDHIHQGEAFDNLLDMRYKKMCNHIRAAALFTDSMMIIRQEDNIMDHQQRLNVIEVSQRTGWELKRNGMPEAVKVYRGYSKRFSSFKSASFYVDKSIYLGINRTALDKSLVKAVNGYMREDFEKALGYFPIKEP
eukprot:jgi/Picsp_1/4964/NSC_02327-R1_---NA---